MHVLHRVIVPANGHRTGAIGWKSLIPAVAVLVGILAGCGDGRLPRKPVSGSVRVAGKPAAGAIVVLHPVAGSVAAEAEQIRPTATCERNGSFVVGTWELADGVLHREDGVTDVPQSAIQASVDLMTYYNAMIADFKKNPADNLTSALLETEVDGDRLGDQEILAFLFLMVIAGNETTTKLLGSSVYWGHRNRDQLTSVFADRSRIPLWVEETLRYDPPVQLVGRVAGEDMTVGDVPVAKGDTMMLLLAAANRDPAVSEGPEVFNPDRQPLRHLAFGLGAHFRLGAPLARLEAAVALSAVTRRFPEARLAGEPVYKPHVTLRGMARLDVTV